MYTGKTGGGGNRGGESLSPFSLASLCFLREFFFRALRSEPATTLRKEVSFLSRSSRLSVALLVCLISPVFPGASKGGVRKGYFFQPNGI